MAFLTIFEILAHHFSIQKRSSRTLIQVKTALYGTSYLQNTVSLNRTLQKPIRALKFVIANKVKQSAQWATDRFVPRDDEKLFFVMY